MIPVYNIYIIYDNTTTTLIEVDEKEDARVDILPVADPFTTTKHPRVTASLTE